MHHSPAVKIVNGEEGFVLVAAMMVLVVLLLIGIAATKSTNVEQQIAANDRTEKQEFFNQETCLATAKAQYFTWIVSPFSDDTNPGAALPATAITDADGIVIATYEARHMEPSTVTNPDGTSSAVAPTTIAGLSSEANDFPRAAPFNSKLKSGDDASSANFIARYYVVTCQSPNADRNSALQEVMYKTASESSQ